ncbi:enoyl-CoA hydratase/isomerase family protein [Variovorax sp. PCZ-1]|uniref:enoyl-CoA hydratase/isomerase family protein n=1 Tax=Variovorax sp. PCZ-1 TaxID=2835533 RepID=UPI001BCC5395|nr:enoyl-CoA hydratase/isomerase family protein [Variovorax sp. PCZ-1]MBS7807861.1 enoyl-CoA hydratase/isomerase family protein [Variovorax sp. PCZ-1]
MLKLDHSGPIATLTLCNALRRNAMKRGMWQELPRLLQSMPKDTRCLILRGEGNHFCSGGDISEYPSFRFEPESLRAFHEEDVAPALDALLALDTPIVAMIAGHCMGGGLELAACADIRIAAQSASFGAPIAKLGMPMAQRELAIVLRAAGEASVREMLLEAKVLNAQAMNERGFIQRIVPDDQLQQETQETAQRIAELSPQAARMNKQFLRRFFDRNQHFSLVNTAQSATESVANDDYAYANSAEHRKGIAAFLAKRNPEF